MRRTALLLTVAAVSAAGCQRTADIQADPAFSMKPLVIDPAIQYRNWEPSVAEYANGAVVAGPTLYPYETARYRPDWQQSLFAPVLFIGQTVMVPVTAFQNKPWSPVVNEGVAFEPTYTAVPPLPPSTPEVYAAIEEAALQPPPPPDTPAPARIPDRAAPQPRRTLPPRTSTPSQPQTPEVHLAPAPAPAPAPQPAETPAATDAVDRAVQQLTQPTEPAPTTQPTTLPELNK